MNLFEFDALIGSDSYVRCNGKERRDTAIVTAEKALMHLDEGGHIGWWVRSGFIVVDIDEGQEKALQIIKALGIKTLMSKTTKGIHLYFRTTKEFPQKIGMVLPCGLKCDFRCANKGYVLLPFNTQDRKFNKCREIAPLPLEFTPLQNRKESLLDKREGEGRNASLFSHLMGYKHQGANDGQIEEMANIINKITFKEPMKQTEIDRIVQSTKNYTQLESTENPYLIYNAKGKPTQINNRAVVDYFVNRGDVFVVGGDTYQYREGVYVEASSYIRNTIRELVRVDHLITQARLMECYRLLTDDIRLQKTADDLNTDKGLINFENGVWDISQRKLLPHDSKHLQTLQILHSYKPNILSIKETRLFKFLKFQADLKNEDIRMILQYMAYTLTLDHGLKTFMVLQGPSNTGKSVLIRFFETLVGKENTSSLSMHELNMRFYPAQLYNRLLNSCADNSSLPLSSIESLKKITGGDQVMHEKKGKEPFFFTPFAKLIFSFNQMPLQLEEKSNAFYKRMRILSMQKELYLNNEYVTDLCSKESIEEIIPHLLGMLPLKEILRTDTSDRLIENLRQDSDSVHAFIQQECVTEKKAVTTKKVIYEAYLRFCADLGREAHKKHTFIRHLKTLGFIDSRNGPTRESTWTGLKLNT